MRTLLSLVFLATSCAPVLSNWECVVFVSESRYERTHHDSANEALVLVIQESYRAQGHESICYEVLD